MKDPYEINLLADFYEYIQEKPYKEIIDIVEEFMEHKDKELTEKAHKDYMDYMESKDNPTLEEIKNGLNTKENELPTPRGYKEKIQNKINENEKQNNRPTNKRKPL